MKINVPYLSTVWATGSFSQNNSNPEWIFKGRKRAVNPAPFYRQETRSMELEDMNKDYVRFSIGKSEFFMDEDRNFYSERMSLKRTLSRIHKMEENYLFGDSQISAWTCDKETDLYFIASVSDLNDNAIVIEEMDPAGFFESVLEQYVANKGMIFRKENEPYIIRAGSLDAIRIDVGGSWMLNANVRKISSVFNNLSVNYIGGNRDLLSLPDNRDLMNTLRESRKEFDETGKLWSSDLRKIFDKRAKHSRPQSRTSP